MGNKSGASGPVISLPKGGGAIQGIGEKFSPDLFTGAGNFTVPLALPPGRNGLQPELNLGYSTGNGNGPFGLGWSVSIPGVSRKTSKGVPRYQDDAPAFEDRDTFILSGAEDLVPLSPASNTLTPYRPRTEGLFARILHHHETGQDDWIVCSKDGLVSYYGTPPGTGNDPAVIADPADRSKIFSWKLSRTKDPYGNRIEYVYERDLGEEGSRQWDQLYLRQIKYVDYREGDVTRFLISVTFYYEDRPDPFSDYRAGFEVRTRKRCTHIEVHTHADTERLVRAYHLIYLDQRPGMEGCLPLNGVSLLSQINVIGQAGDRVEELPPLEFGYTRFEPEKRTFFPLRGRDMPAQSLNDPDTALVDLFGAGLPDIIQMNGKVRYWRNLGQGCFDLPREMRDAPAGLYLSGGGVQFIDADGNGRTDLLVTANGLSGYFPLRFGGFWDRRSFQRYALAPSFNLVDPEVKMVDLTGDGVTDAIRSGARMELFFNDPQAGWIGTRSIERRAMEVFPNVNFSDPRVRFADMTGDGLQDILLIHDGSVDYWPNLGYGQWGKRITMHNSPRFPYGYDPRRILVGDVDGDGLADLVYAGFDSVKLWINRCGNQWSEPIEITGTPDMTDVDAARLADMLGTGTSGVLWSREARGTGRESMYFLDFTGGSKPYLMNEMNNHMGAITRVEYAPSTHDYLEDQSHPETRWATPLPFPVQVVARVEVIDELSQGQLTTEYRYHHGYWDGAEREFRGFGRVDQRDTQTFADFHAAGIIIDRGLASVAREMFSPPLETRTWFHQGPIGDEFGEWEETDYTAEFWRGDPPMLLRPPETTEFLQRLPRRVKRDALRALRGHIVRTELYALDGSPRQERPYTVTEYLYSLREETGPGQDACRVFFPHTLARRTTQWERGDDPLTQFTFTGDYDAYGQPRTQTQIACPRGWRNLEDIPDQSYLATRTHTTYALPASPETYLMDRVARTTTCEIKNDGHLSLFSLNATPGDSPALEIIGQTLNFYDGDAFAGLAFGEIGAFGALVRTDTLVLTGSILKEAYKSGAAVLDPAEQPPYLAPGASPLWTDEYPQAFRDRLPALAGYIFQPGGADSAYAAGYFAATTQRRYDFQDSGSQPGKGLILASRDALGHETGIAYDAYQLLPTRVTDPAGLITQAEYDYAVLQPSQVTDSNENRTCFGFSPLGLLEKTAVMGKAGETAGDTPEMPGTRLEYDPLAFVERKQPVSVRTVRRVHHAQETGVPLPERDATIETVEYSDGFGRLVQTRVQAEDLVFGDPLFGSLVLPADQSLPASDARGQMLPDRVVVSGWQTYDNKGRVVEKYEPFFSTGWDFAQPVDIQLGQKATLVYDPRGQVIRTLHPDGSEQRVIYGVPADLTRPGEFTPTPWEAYTYDANDNAGRTHPEESTRYAQHWNTPASVVIDALGRAVRAVARNGADPADWFVTQSTYDIQGNLLAVIDAAGRVAFKNVYDLAQHPLRIENIDAGLRRTILDAQGNVIEQRDSNAALVLHGVDGLNRPRFLWARDNGDSPVTLRERFEYGDGGDLNQPVDDRNAARAANRLGRVYQQYDEAGRLTFAAYDFKGNVLEKARQVISDTAILAAFDPPPAGWQVTAFRVDWQAADADAWLDPAAYATSAVYDGLNRVRLLRYPQDVDGRRKELRPKYNRAGALERVELDGALFVEHIAYNARGQRTLIAYGNGVMTRYTYDPCTFHLARLRSEHFTQPDDSAYRPTGAPLQDLAYAYDLAGNLLAISDRAPGCGVPGTLNGLDALDREFRYDPLYRLLAATGRERATKSPDLPWSDTIRSQDSTLTRGYAEEYRYDPPGNLVQLRHQANDGSFTRVFACMPGNNRLAGVKIGAQTYPYAYDSNGNLIRENHSRHFEWDHAGRLKAYRTQAGSAEPSLHAQYLYDAGGQRVKKLVRKQGGAYEVTVSIDNLFEHQVRVQAGTVQQNNSLHVMDNQSRIALVRVGSPFKRDRTPAVQYHLGDHLGSSLVVMDGDGALINREEYTPYGETSFGSFARKRYRFTGKERDAESGLYYHGARYYAPWLGRWASCDPVILQHPDSHHDDLPYAYVENRPLVAVDPDGEAINLVAAAIGAGVGALIGGGAEAARQLWTEGKVSNWGQVGASAAGGAVAGGLAGLTMGGSLIVQAGLAGVASAAGGATTRAVLGEKQDLSASVQDFAIGAVTFGLVKGASAALKAGQASRVASAVREFTKRSFQGNWRAFGNVRELISNQKIKYGIKNLFWDSRNFKAVSKQYWRVSGGAEGKSLQHLFFQNQTKWIPQGLRNAGFNLLEVPAELNTWMGGRAAREWTFRGAVGLSMLGAGFGSYEATSSIVRPLLHLTGASSQGAANLQKPSLGGGGAFGGGGAAGSW